MDKETLEKIKEWLTKGEGKHLELDDLEGYWVFIKYLETLVIK